MSDRLAGKKALVTGAAQGLGAAMAQALAQQGALVLLTDIQDAAVAATAAAINAAAGETRAWSARHDVTCEADWHRVVAFAAEALGGLSVLVNNAGIVVTGSIETLSLADWQRGMAVNADSVFLGCKIALPLLRACTPASIINVSSIAGLIASRDFAGYNASKAAVWLLSKSVALHCAAKGWDVRCNSLHPSFVRTPILDGLVGDRDADTILAKLARQMPVGRLGEPEEIAQGVVYLASDESRFMTGAELKLDGGISAQ